MGDSVFNGRGLTGELVIEVLTPFNEITDKFTLIWRNLFDFEDDYSNAWKFFKDIRILRKEVTNGDVNRKTSKLDFTYAYIILKLYLFCLQSISQYPSALAGYHTESPVRKVSANRA